MNSFSSEWVWQREWSVRKYNWIDHDDNGVIILCSVGNFEVKPTLEFRLWLSAIIEPKSTRESEKVIAFTQTMIADYSNSSSLVEFGWIEYHAMVPCDVNASNEIISASERQVIFNSNWINYFVVTAWLAAILPASWVSKNYILQWGVSIGSDLHINLKMRLHSKYVWLGTTTTTTATYLVLIEHKIFGQNIRVAETLEHCVHETAKQNNCFHNWLNLRGARPRLCIAYHVFPWFLSPVTPGTWSDGQT